jgi:hypothetical protein
MAVQGEVRASHEEVEDFVEELRDLYDSLSESKQVMMDTVLDGAQGDTDGYKIRCERPEEAWNDLVGWIAGQDDEGETGTYLIRRGWITHPRS